MLRSCFVIMLFLLFNSRLYSQAIVAGVVIDRTSQKPIEFATIELLRLPDSAVNKASATGKKGKFSIADVSFGIIKKQKEEKLQFDNGG